MSRQRQFEMPDGSKTNDINVFTKFAVKEKRPFPKGKLALGALVIALAAYLLWPENMERCTRKAAEAAQGNTTAFQVMLDLCRRKHTR